jgi:hypothetical protein
MEAVRQRRQMAVDVWRRYSVLSEWLLQKDSEAKMHVERIKFERTGGFAGMRIARDLKLDDLPDEQADSIMELLEDLDFEELPEKLKTEKSMPDQFTYTITVETKKGEHTVTTGDASASEKMQELLRLLDRLARTRKKQ